jgi:hypothetical protein
MRKFFLIIVGVTLFLNAEFIRDFSGIISDTQTGLDWQDNGGIIKSGNWEEALNYCENLTLGNYNNWRLPNINELLSIVDNTKSNPAIDELFTSINIGFYLSSTTLISNTDDVWGVNFIYGGSGLRKKSNKNLVRCVRLNNIE